jgi:PhnB protein
MQAIPYLPFNGNCREAFTFYERVLGGKIVAIHTFGEGPAEMCGHVSKDLVMHARLDLGGDGVLMASDCTPEQYAAPTGICVSLHPTEPAEAERIFHALAEGGTVVMPIEETFWAARFGMVTDRFGIPWMLNCEKAMG